MGLPEKPVTLDVARIEQLNQRLATMRHNVNNHLGLIVAAVELIQSKPEKLAGLLEKLSAQPDNILKEVTRFSEAFEDALGISREQTIGISQSEP